MGVQLAPHFLRLMSPEDQVRYSGVIDDRLLHDRLSVPGPCLNDAQSSRKSATAERKEQSTFASWLLLKNSEGADIPFEWHPLHMRSKTTPGCFDFWVGVSTGIWFEFKRD